MQPSFARFNGGRGLAVEIECNSVVKEFIKFCVCELIKCWNAALEPEGPYEIAVAGFACVFTFEIANERWRCSSSSASPYSSKD